MKRPASRLTVTALLTALLIAGSFIRIPLPGGVPLTLQVFFALLGPALLGIRGALPALLYIFLGLAGLPVFSGGGGPGYLVSPTFGYLAGFVLGGALAGVLYPRAKTVAGGFVALSAGLGVIYLTGGAWLYWVKNIYMEGDFPMSLVIKYGVVPFLPLDLLKTAGALWTARRIRPALGQLNR
ncbi:MAG TPA: biotin transporter BioY [Candidatus Mcinerneyibacteriales bacterium]|nr:biotin transporter BioY [Candidatus Mcinerneyibacteriales bacterium]HPE20877.1 biotin transporter BioY [Candidatus Mcinerneyibacteriales bacterium]